MTKTTKEKVKPTTMLGTGGIPSPEDYRDVPLAAVAPIAAGTLPDKFFVDLKKIPVWHQRKIGACVGHAGAKYKQILDRIETGKVFELSPRFLYAMAKSMDNYKDEGTYPRLVAQIMVDYGVATEKTVPNDTKLTHEKYVYNRKIPNIPQTAFKDALPFRAEGYAFPNVKKVDELKRAIVDFHGAMLLVRLGSEWYTSKTGKTSWDAKDILPLRPPADVISGHEIYLFGYEVVGKRVKMYILNSWSEDWGDDGIGWFWYDEYQKHIDEAITIVDLPNDFKDTLDELPAKEFFKYEFKKLISKGDRGEDVKALQTALMIDGNFDKTLYIELLKNNELGYYGTATQTAVASYQKEYNLASIFDLGIINGRYIGPKTRAHLNAWTNK